jgi:hypothetical protein
MMRMIAMLTLAADEAGETPSAAADQKAQTPASHP